MEILAKVLFFGFAAFWTLGILLYLMAPMLRRFIRHRLTNHDQRKSKPPTASQESPREPGQAIPTMNGRQDHAQNEMDDRP